MTQEEKSLLQEKMKEEVINLSREIESLKEMVKPEPQGNEVGRVSKMDAINNKSVMQSSLNTKVKRLKSLTIKLENIDNETFGNCANCSTPININRLLYRPESSLCIRCAR